MRIKVLLAWFLAVVPQLCSAQTAEVSPAINPGAPPAAFARTLTLGEALDLAEANSEQIQIARAGIERAEAGQQRARSEGLPQLFAAAGYDRTLRSEFQGLFDQAPAPGPPCPPLNVDPAAPVEQRLSEVERFLRCGGNAAAGFGDFGELPFGRENIYRGTLSFSQLLYSGGRVSGQVRMAQSGRETADVNLASVRAQLKLDVVQAYFNAVMSDRLVTIAEAALQQAEDTLEQVRIGRSVGAQPEFELLRAHVSRDNLRPSLIRRRSDRDIAYTRLKQLLDLPQDLTVNLISALEADELELPREFNHASEDLDVEALNQRRAPVREAGLFVRMRESALQVARSQRLPSVALSSTFSPVAYPDYFPTFGDFRNNWTVGLSLQIPVFVGGRLEAEERSARADLEEARARLAQIREHSDLDARTAIAQLGAARATWEASAGTVEQAERAYQIAEVRYREGISTQLELSDARFLLEQARVNRAQAARDLQVARVRVALLPDLPLSPAGAFLPEQFIGGADLPTGNFGQDTGTLTIEQGRTAPGAAGSSAGFPR
jgi:outer membrane protein TolC